MMINVEMLCPVMKRRVRCQINRGKVITKQFWSLRQGNTEKPKNGANPFNHFISDNVSDRERYSASVEFLDTVGCFFEDHDMRFCPVNVKKLPVDFLVSLQFAQSLSL